MKRGNVAFMATKAARALLANANSTLLLSVARFVVDPFSDGDSC